jgi:hypothetical protein
VREGVVRFVVGIFQFDLDDPPWESFMFIARLGFTQYFDLPQSITNSVVVQVVLCKLNTVDNFVDDTGSITVTVFDDPKLVASRVNFVNRLLEAIFYRESKF